MKRHPNTYEKGLYVEKTSHNGNFLVSLKKHPKLAHFTDADWSFLAGAHTLALEAHKHQGRYSSLPYITHPEGCVWIYLEEITSGEAVIKPIDIATIICHDVIEDCPDFREALYSYSRELFWDVATQSEMAKPEVVAYLTRKKSEETLVGLMNPGLAYVMRFASNTAALLDRIARVSQHTFYQGENLLRIPVDTKERLVLIQISTYDRAETEKKAADRVYNLRDRHYFPEKKLPGFQKTIAFTRRLLIPHAEWLYLENVAGLLTREADAAGEFLSKLHDAK